MPAPAYAFAVFLGAFLLFQVQPLLGRYILPWFGGGPSVWTSCLLFFQALLLGGYAYAHGVASRLGSKWQGRLHLALLVVSLFALPIDPDAEVWTGSYDNPTGTIMLLLLVTAGLPYLILSATSPLLQRWFHWQHPTRSSYRLYALSNAGSLIALLSYPFVFEPLLPVRMQAELWSWAYGAFVVACGWCAWGVSRRPGNEPAPETEEEHAPPTSVDIMWWLALSACGSALLLATTNQTSQEVAVVPFLWVLPLSLYLLSFILCFESDRWYRRTTWAIALAVTTPAACVMLGTGGVLPLEVQILVFSAALFAGCMACHGELALTRPHGRHATKFYLILALGGALGGLFVAIVAPRLFPAYWEYPFSLAAACMLTLYFGMRRGGWSLGPRTAGVFSPPPALLIALFAVGYTFSVQAAEPHRAERRNFYGVLQVTDVTDQNGQLRKLTHGRTEHGAQYLDAHRRFQPTTYFGPGTGAELAFQEHPARKAGRPLRIGVVGLGAGTLAAYGRPGDLFRFYEINPAVVELAGTQFSYLSDSPAKIEVVQGDARVRMEEELAQGRRGGFDILVVDAFSSGAIPLHLLTGEAGEIYAQHLKENGVLLFHITNRFLDLTPVLRGMASRLGMQAARVESGPKPAAGVSAATWMFLTRNDKFLQDPPVASRLEKPRAEELDWTDNFAGLWQALR